MELEPVSSLPIANERRQPRRGSNRIYRTVGIAAILSLLLHVALVYFFSDIRLVLPAYTQSQVFRIPRTEINAESLRPAAESIPDATDVWAPPKAEDKLPDLTTLQDMIPPDRDIAITPNVTAPENLRRGNAMVGKEALENINPGELEKSVSTLASKGPNLEDLAPMASPNQPVIQLGGDGDDASRTDSVLKKAVAGNHGLSDKYTTLDDAIGVPGGELKDIRKPIYMPSDLLFDFREYRLRESAKTSMMMLGILIERSPNAVFVIQGHTDTIGSDESNLELSRKRAQAVCDWLQQSLRIEPSRLYAEGLGESAPLVAPDGNIEEQQPNRRVEIIIRKVNGTPNPAPAATEPAILRNKQPIEPSPQVRPAKVVGPGSPQPEVRSARPVSQ